jgi:hypothetical protein
MNRREWLVAGVASSVLAGGRGCQIDNGAVRFLIDPNRARTFVNRLSGETVKLPVEDFRLLFRSGQEVTSTAMAAEVELKASGRLVLRYADHEGLEARVEYHAPTSRSYLRKQISLRRVSGEAPRLMRADLENWSGVRRDWQSIRKDRYPYGSHPIWCENLWAGVEFVAAFNEWSPEGFRLRSRPGGVPIGRQWVRLHSTVLGVAPAGQVRDGFLRYIDDVRLVPPRMAVCYNTWWTLPAWQVKPEATMALLRRFKEELFDRRGTFFDLVAADAGWSDPHRIWQIDRGKLPGGFREVRALVESAGGKLGLWMSPSEMYPAVFDYRWAEERGYAMVRSAQDIVGISLADPEYREEAKRQLQRLICEEGLAHIKYDGFLGREERAHHDLLPGEDSVEPLAEYALELLKVSKEANPALITEPTYLNTYSNYISPWTIKYSDTLWANAGGDAPRGMYPAPDYREAMTSAREYFIFYSLGEVWLPQNALQYFDIVHCDASGGFPNHVAMAVGRGRFFLATYLNPSLLGEADWDIYAGFLKWARRNRDLLRETVVLPGRVEAGEPYAYAHWTPDRGLIVVRNPSNETRKYRVALAEARMPRSLRDAVCFTQYPYRRGLASGIEADGELRMKLAPWELLYVEVRPRARLGEPVALGARWYRDASGRMCIVPDAGAAKVRILEREGEREIAATRARSDMAGEVLRHSIRRVPEAEWLRPWFRPRNISDTAWAKLREAPLSTVSFEVECAVSVPEEVASASVLLLVQFPGRRFQPSRCTAVVDGKPIKLHERHSAGRLGGHIPKTYSAYAEVLTHENEWTWYLCDVPAGHSQVRFTGAAADTNLKTGLWLWAERNLTGLRRTTDVACEDPPLPGYGEHLERDGICLKRP